MSKNIYKSLEEYDLTGKTGRERKRVLFSLKVTTIKKLKALSKEYKIPMSRIIDEMIL